MSVFRRFSIFPFLMLALLYSTGIRAGDDASKDSKDETKKSKDEVSKATDEIVATTHSVKIGDATVAYLARTGTILLKEEDGTPKAKVFFIAYEKEGIENPRTRPVTFAFNGGPGSSSVWLHLGVLGPKRVFLDEEGYAPPPPYRLIDNEESILDRTDLVFIDPVTTGFSRAVPGEDPKQYHGVQEDIESVGEFIRLYTTRYKRWSSPKFLAGESYGTLRAAGLAGHLQNRHGMYLNGLVLVSCALNFQTISFDHPGNDLPYVLFLPSYAATAWYHKQLPDDLQGRALADVLAEAGRFATNDYNLALMQGDSLSEPDREEMIRSVARWTGVSEDFVDRSDLRIPAGSFRKELLRDEGRTVGRFDSRFKGIDRKGTGDWPDYDASYTVIQGAFTTLMNDYVRADLKFESDLPYEILSGRVWPWDYGDYENRYLNVAETLRQAMTENPHLMVFVASGYYDLATPFLATDYTFNHIGLDRSLQENLALRSYEAGHMMYTHKPSLQAFKADLAEYFDKAFAGGPPTR
jgi:carboxypeptidase C (cathepsin A)